MTRSVYMLSKALGERLRQLQWTLAVAESCTGGALASQIVAVPGSSDYFLGGVVAYANEVKTGILGVAPSTLAEHGAVSWQTATEMAWGVLRLFGAKVALSTTGIAGPTGGTPTKPVGLVYIALATTERAWWERHLWSGSRGENIAQSVEAALRLLECHLNNPGGRFAEDGRGDRGEVTLGNSAQDIGGSIPVEVICREDGTRPLAFVWRSQRYPITSWGRSWQDESGRQHHLVMSGLAGAFELCFDPAEKKWYLLQAWQKPAIV